MALIEMLHGTSMSRLSKIFDSNELIPQASFGIGENGGVSEADKHLYNGYTFFTDKERIALDYAFYSNLLDKDTEDILPVLVFHLPEEILLPDDNDSAGSSWCETAERIGQVKVHGSVSLDFLSCIRYYKKPENISGLSTSLFLYTKNKRD